MSRGRQAQAVKLLRQEGESLEAVIRRGAAPRRQNGSQGRDDNGNCAGSWAFGAVCLALAQPPGQAVALKVCRKQRAPVGPGESVRRSAWSCWPWRVSPP